MHVPESEAPVENESAPTIATEQASVPVDVPASEPVAVPAEAPQEPVQSENAQAPAEPQPVTVEDFQSPVAEAAPAEGQTDKTQDPNGANSSVKGPESMVPEIDQDNFVEPESPQTIAAA